MALIYNASFDSQTRVLSLLDKAGNAISSCEVPSNDVDDATKPLMFKSQTNGATISTNAENLDFSRNGIDWETYTANTALEVNSGGRVFFKARTNAYSSYYDKTHFSMTGEFKAFNNLMSVYLVNFATVTNSKLYYKGMFSGQTGLLKAPMLTQTYIANETYTDTFSGCTGLEEDAPLPPVLTFEDLSQEPINEAYYFRDMYKGCTGLKRIRSFENYESGGTVQQFVFATGRMFPSLGSLPTREKYVSVKFPLALPVDGVVHDTHVPPNATDHEPFYLRYSQDWVLYITSVLREYYSRESMYLEQAGAYEYSYDGETWNLGYAGYEHNKPVNVPANTKLYIRRCMYPYKPLQVYTSGPSYYSARKCTTRSFSFSVDCEVGGDTWSLDRADFYSLPSSYAQDLHGLFRGTYFYIDSEEYSPCSALSSSVNLHAHNYNDLKDMFNGCSSLRRVAIAINSVSAYKFTTWMSDVSSSGDFYCNPNIDTFPLGSGGVPVGWNRWVYGAEDTGTTTNMYHNGVAETVMVGTSDYGVCYSIQGWAGFKTLEQMHEAGYTFGEQTASTLYEYEDMITGYTVPANSSDGFTEAMYDTCNGRGYLTIEQQNKRGYYASPVAFTGLVLTATANSSSVKLYNHNDNYYSKGARLFTKYRVNTGDGWQTYTNNTVINLDSGQEVKLHCIAYRGQTSPYNYMRFNMKGTLEASGNCNSMYPMDIRTDMSLNGYPRAFANMFSGCKSLVQAPALPATTLAQSCYSSMFYGCSSLTSAPQLPATTLADSCYYSMFNGCSGLIQAPELPATTLANYCYRSMFSGCQSLKEVRVSATTTATNALNDWLSGVSATGDFYCDPDATIFPTNSASGIPQNWTRKPLSDYPATP